MCYIFVMKDKLIRKEYFRLFSDIKARIIRAQYDALKAVNKELIGLYWDIGRMIVERQKGNTWGKAVVENLAADLQKEFPGMQGFSAQNLWRMKQFYQIYADDKFLSPMVREIGWTHNVIILMHCKDSLERAFYIEMTRKFGWTKNVLAMQIDNGAYDKYRNNQTNFDKTVTEKVRDQAKLAVKDEYTFDFLELGEDYAESQLERGLVNNIRKFLLEMGGHFCFIGNQYRLEVEGVEFFVDLLLYHRKLKCLVAVELKSCAFKPEHAGKMNFYLSVLNDKVRLEDENPAIGIIVCRDKKRTIVEFALKDIGKPMGVSTYSIKHSLPQKLAKYFPSAKILGEGIGKLSFDH